MEQLDQRSKISAPIGTKNQPLSLQPIPPATLAQKALRGLVLAAAMMVSATVGLSTALILPLPAQLGPNDKGPRSLGYLLENGLQYTVARPVNILVMGIDRVPGAQPGTPAMFDGRSDTMLLLRVDPKDDSVRLLSIPRDTQVEIPGIGVTKINDANVRGGAKLAVKTASNTLNKIAIDRYVRISTDAFRELVDQLGGVEMYVPAPMSYEDKTQKLKIQLSPGLQTLNGDQAEQFARFRNDGFGDIGRVQRQQALLKALLKRVTTPLMLPRLPGMVQAMQKYIDTNLSTEELLALVGAGRQVSQGNFKMVMLPGRFSGTNEFRASYWIMNPDGRDRVLQQYFDLKPDLKTSDAIADDRIPASLRIAIQNASTQPNAAQQMRKYLSTQGFTNTYIAGDWADHQSQTQIVAQQGDLKGARELQKMLGLGNVAADSTGDLDSDLTVRIGNDWVNPLK